MRIDRVILENFRTHSNVDVELGPGLVGVLGSNGSGKSSFVKAILRGLTGSTGDPGKQEQDIRDGAERGFIQVFFTVEGKQGILKRQLKTAGCSMKFGDKDWKSSTEIADVLYDVLGVSEKVLRETVFIAQGLMEGILFQRPAERAKSFQLLFGTDNAEKIRELIDNELKQTVAEDREGLISTLKAELDGPLATGFNEIEQSMRKLVTMPAGVFKACTEIVTMFETQKRMAESSVRAKEAADEIAASMRQLVQRINNTTVRLDKTTQVIKTLTDDYYTAGILIQDYSAACLRAQQRQSLLRVIKQFEDVLVSSEPKLSTQVSKKDLELKRSEYNWIAAQLDICEKVISGLRGAAVCPTCQQPVDQKFVQAKVEFKQGFAGRVQALQQLIYNTESSLSDFERNHAAWSANIRNAQAQHKKATEELKQFPTELPPSSDAFNEAKELRTEYEGMVRARAEAATELQSLNQHLVTLDRQLKSAKAVNTGSADVVSVAEADYEEAKKRLADNVKQGLDSAKLTGKLEELNKRRQTLLEQVAVHEADMVQLKPIKAWKDLLERAKLILHRDQLPAMVTRAFLKPLNVRLNHYLALFQVPFTTVLNADQTIDCVFPNGAIRSADRLSGGQKVAMGIAFRFAIYDKFASNLGFLVLDEPTPYLDVVRREGVLELLMNVKSYSKQAGLQIIVVTHDEMLLGAFDKVIRFEEPTYISKS